MRNATKLEIEEAAARLLTMLSPGDTIWAQVRHVSASGMSRRISLYIPQQGEDGKLHIRDLTRDAGIVVFHKARGWDEPEGFPLSGCGMDMTFSFVYDLSRSLFPEGFDCIGQGCPSNDHFNGDRDYTPHRHKDGGYALGKARL